MSDSYKALKTPNLQVTVKKDVKAWTSPSLKRDNKKEKKKRKNKNKKKI